MDDIFTKYQAEACLREDRAGRIHSALLALVLEQQRTEQLACDGRARVKEEIDDWGKRGELDWQKLGELDNEAFLRCAYLRLARCEADASILAFWQPFLAMPKPLFQEQLLGYLCNELCINGGSPRVRNCPFDLPVPPRTMRLYRPKTVAEKTAAGLYKIYRSIPEGKRSAIKRMIGRK